jgi:CheY-like chemotaxis protein
VFSIEVPVASQAAGVTKDSAETDDGAGKRRVGTILLVEDEESVRDSLELLLKKEGHRVTAVANGEAALALVAKRVVRPDLVICDYNLSGAMNGVRTAASLGEALGSPPPVIILTGDVRVAMLRDIASHGYLSRKKPLKAQELLQDVQRQLGAACGWRQRQRSP